jgi:hypothetical protein
MNEPLTLTSPHCVGRGNQQMASLRLDGVKGIEPQARRYNGFEPQARRYNGFEPQARRYSGFWTDERPLETYWPKRHGLLTSSPTRRIAEGGQKSRLDSPRIKTRHAFLDGIG